MSSEEWIVEKHISKKALPKENIISWVKWNPDLVPNKITLKYDPDIIVTKILNVSEEGIPKNPEEDGGIITISKEHLQIPGFFGFTCFYNEIPEEEKTINYVIEFAFENEIKKVEQTNKVIRPILEFEKTDYTLVSSQFGSNVTPLDFKLINKGTARPDKLRPFVEVSNTPDMEIKIQTKIDEIKDESLVLVKSNKISVPKFMISGMGYGMVSFGFEYQDTLGNSYKSSLANLAIQIEEKQTLQVPYTENISTTPIPLLEAIM